MLLYDFLKWMNMISPKLQMMQWLYHVRDYTYVYFLCHGEGLLFYDFFKCMNMIFWGFQMTITVLQHLNDTSCLLSP